MASSISSKRAFSSARITITKRCNRLKPDIIEALQFLKCLYQRDLLFREEASTEQELEELEGELAQLGANTEEGSEEIWDADVVVEGLLDDEGFKDHEDHEVFMQEIVLLHCVSRFSTTSYYVTRSRST